MFSFSRNMSRAGKQYAEANGNPDIIYASSLTPLALIAGQKLAKRFGIQCICEIRDLWPESFKGYLGKNKWFLLAPLFAKEKRIYARADKLIFTMEGGRDYIIEKAWDIEHGGPIGLANVYHINNGVDLEAYDSNAACFTIDDADIFDGQTIKFGYTGSIRTGNNVELLLDAAKHIKDPRARILIWGKGDDVDAIIKRIVDEAIRNVKYKGAVGKQYIPFILNHMHVNVNTVSETMHRHVFRFGTSQNKTFEYFAAGRPVLSNLAENYSNYQKYECGIADSFSPEQYAEQIDQFCKMPKEKYELMCQNARRAAEAFDFAALTQRLIAVIES
jgi:glycosyltransferase involved in cell wall biosynthesis